MPASIHHHAALRNPRCGSLSTGSINVLFAQVQQQFTVNGPLLRPATSPPDTLKFGATETLHPCHRTRMGHLFPNARFFVEIPGNEAIADAQHLNHGPLVGARARWAAA